MQSQMIGLQTSLDRILATVTQPGAPGVMPPGPPIYPQMIREGPDMSQMCPELAPVSTLNMIRPLRRTSAPLHNALSLLSQAFPPLSPYLTLTLTLA